MLILKVDINGKVSKKMIRELVKRHETLQDPMVVEYTDLSIPDGFAISRFDGLVEDYVRGQLKDNPKFLEDNADVKKKIHEQKEHLSKEKFISL